MILQELSPRERAKRLRRGGLRVRTGPFVLCLHSEHVAIGEQLATLYPLAPVLEDDAPDLTHFTIHLQRPLGLRRWWRPQIALSTDAATPFAPFPLDHALPLLEWGYNWCIATQAHHFLMLHAAVVEKDGLALIMPALPGSGKSTLCAALMLRGWRLLTDEFGLIRPDDPELRLWPLPRPVALKNASIKVIRHFAPDAVLGPTFAKTRKGDVAHLMPSLQSQRDWALPARPGWVLFPRFEAGAATHMAPLGRGWTFLKLSGNSFNYKLQGARGFKAVAELVKRCPAEALNYSDMDEAIARIEARHAELCALSPDRVAGPDDPKAPAAPADR